MKRHKTGFALAIIFPVIVLLFIAVAAVGSISVANLFDVAKDVYAKQASYAAEGGVQDGLALLKVNGGAFASTQAYTNPNGSSIKYSGTIYPPGTTVTVNGESITVPSGFSLVVCTGSNSNGGSRTLTALAGLTVPFFGDALLGSFQVNFQGNVTVDAYNSTSGPYPGSKVSGDANVQSYGAAVGSISIGAAATTVDGNLYYVNGATPSVNKNATITGTEIVKPPSPLPYISPGISAPVINNPNYGTTLPSGVYPTFNPPNNTNVTLQSGGTYYFPNDVSFGAKSSLTVTGPVVIYVGGNWDSTAGTLINTTLLPNDLTLIGTSTTSQTINFGGHTAQYAVFYFPNGTLNMSGTADLYGVFAGSTVNVKGTGAIHYDISTRNNPFIPPADEVWTVGAYHRQ